MNQYIYEMYLSILVSAGIIVGFLLHFLHRRIRKTKARKEAQSRALCLKDKASLYTECLAGKIANARAKDVDVGKAQIFYESAYDNLTRTSNLGDPEKNGLTATQYNFISEHYTLVYRSALRGIKALDVNLKVVEIDERKA